MIGQYTEEEIKIKIRKGTIISSINDYFKGYLIIKKGHTVNYYKREKDKSWKNYNCKTVY